MEGNNLQVSHASVVRDERGEGAGKKGQRRGSGRGRKEEEGEEEKKEREEEGVYVTTRTKDLENDSPRTPPVPTSGFPVLGNDSTKVVYPS